MTNVPGGAKGGAGGTAGAPRPVTKSGPVRTSDTSTSFGKPLPLSGAGAPPAKSTSDIFKKGPPIERVEPKGPERKSTGSGRLPMAGEPLTPSSSSPRMPASTVIRPLAGVSRPGSTSTRISLGSRASGAAHWSCTSCKSALPMDALVKGLAELQDGKLLCARCIGKDQPKKEKPRIAGWKLAAVAVVIFAAISLIVPGQAVFIALLGSLCVIAVGAVSYQMRAVYRVALVVCGILSAAGCVYGITAINERKEALKAQAELEKSVAEIEGLLKEDRFNEAQARFMAFDASSKNMQGLYRTPQFAQKVGEINAKFEEWFKKRYGEVTEKDRIILSLLIKSYPEGGSLGVKRYKSLHLEGTKLALAFSVNLDPDAKDPQRAILDKSKTVIMGLGEHLKGLGSVEFTVATVEDMADAKTYTLERKQLDMIMLSDMTDLLGSAKP